MIRAIIIEDEQHAAELLEEMLKEIEPRILIVQRCENLSSAVKCIKLHQPELVFLDVELPVYNGLQLLDFLNPEEISFRIIFTTASNQYAMRAFDMSAVDYVLKPLQFDKLKSAVQKFMSAHAMPNNYPIGVLRDNFFNYGPQKIVVPVANGFEIIQVDEIMYIRAEGSYSKIQDKHGQEVTISHNLKYFEVLLSADKKFIRIHRSHIANLNFAKKIIRNDGNFLIMEDDTELAISGDRTEVILGYFNFQRLG